MSETLLHKIAAVVSALLQPIFVPLYALLLWWMIVPEQFGRQYCWYCSAIVLIFSFLLPGAIHLFYYFTGRVSNFFISNRHERRRIYMISISCVLLGYILLEILDFWPISSFMRSSMIALTGVWIINYFWKISAHMAAWSCLVGCVFVFEFMTHRSDIEMIEMLVLLTGLLGWSRLEQRAHTLGQVLCGCLLGVASALTMTLDYFLGL